ncbi:hypothetical protein E4T43_00429 [Aureobasidium subglaciale]|nr:hypothetical protein E4T43_00429 [Aureobasidium subglaciale]
MSEAADSRGLANPVAKRKRSPSLAPHQAFGNGQQNKAPKTGNVSSQLQINYIARQCIDDLPFISKEDTLPALLDVLSSYTQVLDRHESLASNLGARPLGPILIKRFERCFDAPPRVIASHSHARDSDLPQVTWLDVVHFAKAHPSQFTLSTFSEGRRVCQFYYPQKQVRVQISEEDFVFINSGRCQDLVPPLPIWEDEEKEVATCEIVEKALRDLTAAADNVAARTRQLTHRLKGRRMAILERRSAEESHNQEAQQQALHPSFVSVNNNQQQPVMHQPQQTQQQQPPTSPEKTDPALHIRNDLLKHFQSLPKPQPDNRRVSSVQQQPQSPPFQTPPNFNQHPRTNMDPASTSVSPVPTTVAALAAAAAAQASNYTREESPQSSQPRHNFSKPLPPAQEVSQPYRTLCQAHMESLPRGSRVMPPCDRCRRLKMDCLKNLSSCGGCTKKHARCHWKQVSREEVQGLEGFEEADRVANEYANGTRRFSSEYAASDTSMDVDVRSPFDYPSHTAASTPGNLQAFARQGAAYPEVQQQSGYPQPPSLQQQQGNGYEEYRPAASVQRNPFPEDFTQQAPPQQQPQSQPLQQQPQQQTQTQQQQDRTMDLLRVLGNHNNGIASPTPTPDQPQQQLQTQQNRNHGAFRTSFTPANEPATLPQSTTQTPTGQENGEGQRV